MWRTPSPETTPPFDILVTSTMSLSHSHLTVLELAKHLWIYSPLKILLQAVLFSAQYPAVGYSGCRNEKNQFRIQDIVLSTCRTEYSFTLRSKLCSCFYPQVHTPPLLSWNKHQKVICEEWQASMVIRTLFPPLMGDWALNIFNRIKLVIPPEKDPLTYLPNWPHSPPLWLGE